MQEEQLRSSEALVVYYREILRQRDTENQKTDVSHITLSNVYNLIMHVPFSDTVC